MKTEKAAAAGLMDELFEVAFEYKDLKLWKKLWDDQIFAVRCEDGTVLYACVMGKNGEYTAIAFYEGVTGLDTLRLLHAEGNNPFLDESERLEVMYCQDCVACSFERMDALRPTEQEQLRDYCRRTGRKLRGANACPHLERLRPNHVPWNIREERDKRHLLECLRAACEVAKRLQARGATPESLGLEGNGDLEGSCPLLVREGEGWSWQETELPEAQEILYETPALSELEAKRLKKCKKRKQRATWALEIMLMPIPVTEDNHGHRDLDGRVEEPYEAPYHPFMLLGIELQEGMVIIHELTKADGSQQPLLEAVAHAIDEHGCPAAIQVRDERTEAFCQAWTQQLGIDLQYEDEIPELEEAKNEVLRLADGSAEDMQEDIMLEVMSQLDDPEALAALDNDGLAILAMLADQSPLPDAVKAKIRQEMKHRGQF